MLIEFSVENFLSIKEKLTLSLLASKDKSLDDHLISPSCLNQQHLLKSGAIYGANASGKSNFLKAVSFFQGFILNSHKMQQGDEIDVVPFKLDENFSSSPSRFEMLFIHEGVRYAYGFSADKSEIHEEYLYYYPKGRQSLIFERSGAGDYTFTADRKEQKELSSRTPRNMLYLSNATRWNFRKTADPFHWLKQHLKVVTAHEKANFRQLTAEMIVESPHLRETFNRCLREADLGINGIRLSKKTGPSNETLSLHTQHTAVDKTGNEKELYFRLEEESDGMQKFFSLLGPVIDVLSNGYVLFIDELEASLHPHLTRFLVNLFHNLEQNKNNAQLVFSAHDTNLINLFRRDQVWFTEKNAAGSTDLFSLLEFSPRKDQNVEKGYLSGRYGAIPFLGDGNIL